MSLCRQIQPFDLENFQRKHREVRALLGFAAQREIGNDGSGLADDFPGGKAYSVDLSAGLLAAGPLEIRQRTVQMEGCARAEA